MFSDFKATAKGSLFGFFLQWLGATRASDSPVPGGHRFSCCFCLTTLIPVGTVSHAAPNKSPDVFPLVRYRVTRGTGLDQVVKKGGVLAFSLP